MDRRQFIKFAFAGTGALVLGRTITFENVFAAGAFIEKINKSNEEWKKMLNDEQYKVLREEGTERPFSSPLNNEKRTGKFVCAGCGLELFLSDTKFDSGTGWPSFYQAIEGHVETKTDNKLGMQRTEYHCTRCRGHQGHVFEDGPKPTGLRYCNNGVALKFVPDKA
jgi:peptide-methionine (R)-S-oxide reductase